MECLEGLLNKDRDARWSMPRLLATPTMRAAMTRFVAHYDAAVAERAPCEVDTRNARMLRAHVNLLLKYPGRTVVEAQRLEKVAAANERNRKHQPPKR